MNHSTLAYSKPHKTDDEVVLACPGGKRHLLQGDAGSLLAAITAGEQSLGIPAPAPQAQSELNAALGGIERAFGSPSPSSGDVPLP